MKASIESQFQYYPLVWMFHSRTINNRINKLHERALRLVYKDDQYTFKQLLDKDNTVTIHHRNLQKLAIEMYKLQNNLSPTFMKEIYSKNKFPLTLLEQKESGNLEIIEQFIGERSRSTIEVQ